MVHPFHKNIDWERTPGETVRGYLARQGKHRDGMVWDGKHDAFRYPVDRWLGPYEDETQETLDRYVKTLPLVVPGIDVVGATLHKFRSNEGSRGYVWFTWSEDAMWARLREVFDEYGVADERLAYCRCSGEVELPDGQRNLPGVVEVEPRGTQGTLDWTGHPRWFMASYTWWGLMLIDSAFGYRIRNPDRGGPSSRASGDHRCQVGNEWWLIGSRGDSAEVMTLEIQGSPLQDRTKENLLLNLENYRAAEGISA